MTFPRTIHLLLGLWVAARLTAVVVHPNARQARTRLETLAANAASRNGWGALRRAAASARDSKTRGQAYFVLGYREYDAGEGEAAEMDLARASETQFSLGDLAEYYRALAARLAGHPEEVIRALNDFAGRHPESPLKRLAGTTLAQGYLDAGQPERAIAVLRAEPKVQQEPDLLLLLARAYEQAGQDSEAARTYEEVYYLYPLSEEAKPSREALARLQSALGAAYPLPTAELQVAQADHFYQHGRFDEALAEYDAMLKASPTSVSVSAWKVRRGRCLVRLRRFKEALDALQIATPGDPAADAERLASLVDAYARQDDEASLAEVLDQLHRLYPQSLSYAAALNTAANHSLRRGDWDAALSDDQSLAASFPRTEESREARWRVAWILYVQKEHARARDALRDYVTQYPDSAHVPAAIYWLGRLAEEAGATADARSLYDFLEERFAHHYYAREAQMRLQKLPSGAPAGRPKTGGGAGAGATYQGLLEIIPARAPAPMLLCAPPPPNEALETYRTLKALSLDAVGEEYLRAALDEHPELPELRLALARAHEDEGNAAAALFVAMKFIPEYSDFRFTDAPREIWSLLYPQSFRKLVERQTRAYGLDPYLIMALIRQESAFNPRALSSAGARGLMQVLPQTASPSRRRRRVAERNLFNPLYNVRVGCHYFRKLLTQFDGNVEQALAAYHAGDFRVRAWLEERSFGEPAEFVESIPIPSTRVYVENVLRDATVYRQLMTGAARFKKCS